MKALVFTYKWPRIKEGLIHGETEISHSWHLNEVYGPVGAFMYCSANWYLRKTRTGAPWSLVDAQLVPKEIRALALILT